MPADPPIDQTDAPGSLSAVAASATPTHLHVTLEVAPDADNAMFWVDGVLVTEWYGRFVDPPATPFEGHSLSAVKVDGVKRYALAIDRAKFPVSGGRHTITASAFGWSNPPETLAYRSVAVDVPPAPQPAVVPGRVVRTAFWSDPKDMTPAITAAFKNAGFNCVSGSIFQNPADGNPQIDTFEKWAARDLPWLRSKLQWCRANGLLFWGFGDDMIRLPHELEWAESTPWFEQAARAVFALRREYPEFVAVSMVDEIGLFGQHPDGSPLYGAMAGWSREEGGPLLSWPSQRSGVSSPWEAPDRCDIADRFWSAGNWVWKDGRPKQPTVWQFANAAVYLASVRPGQPLAFKCEGSGAFYRKLAPGGDYQPGVDELVHHGPTPNGAVLSVWLPLAYGCTALRLYALNTPEGDRQRLVGAIGSEQQTGLKFGTPVGDAVAEAMRAVARHEPALLGEVLPPGRVGHWVVGRRPNLTFWIATTDDGSPCPGGSGGEGVYGGRVVIYGG